MTDQSQPSAQRKPKSLLETHQDAHILIKALNEFAASQQKPVSRDMMSAQTCSSSSRSPMPFLCPKSTPSDPPQDEQRDPATSDASSSNSIPKPVKGSGIPIMRRRLLRSEQPSVSKLAELGVKVRDFAYESTLPPVPTVYLQPRQIQPSVPKDVNDPNDPHYVLEEERKKKVYTFESTRKIERTPTEPALESDLLPPPRRTFPKIKRANAQLDLGSQSQSQSQPQSQPLPVHPVLPYDITNTPLSVSQPVPGLATDSQQTEPWVDTPIVTPNGSLQWPSGAKVEDASAVATSQLEPTVSDSQASPVTEPMSYSQMGFMDLDGGIKSPDHDNLPRSSNVTDLVATTRTLTPTRGVSKRGRVEPKRPSPSPSRAPLVPTSPAEPLPSSPQPQRDPASLARSPIPAPVAGPSRPSTPPSPHSPSTTTSPRYNLRKNKRRAESPPPMSPTKSSTRPRLTRAQATQSASLPTIIGGSKPSAVVSAKSTHAQDKANPNVISTGRTMKRGRANTVSGASGEEDMRRAKRRK